MYDTARYSLIRYSMNQEDRTIPIGESFSESVGALAGAAVPVEIRCRFVDGIQGSARGTVSIVLLLQAQDKLGARVRMLADILSAASFCEAMQGGFYAQKNLPVDLAASELLTGRPWASKSIPTELALTDQLRAGAAGGKNTPGTLSVYEVLGTLLAATVQDTERAVFTIAIPPGGELRIDSELFTVLLNGQNVLHIQSGDWINVSRELLRLNIESASGELEGQMIYTERYL